MGSVFAEPVERLELAAVIIVDHAGEVDPAFLEPGDVLARSLNKVEPLQAVGSIVGVFHLGGYDLGGLDGDPGRLLHLRIDSEHAFGADAAASRSSLLFQDHYAEPLLGGLDGGGKPGVAGAADADVAVVGSHCVERLGAGALLVLGRILLRSARVRARRRAPCQTRPCDQARGSGDAEKAPSCQIHDASFSNPS